MANNLKICVITNECFICTLSVSCTVIHVHFYSQMDNCCLHYKEVLKMPEAASVVISAFIHKDTPVDQANKVYTLCVYPVSILRLFLIFYLFGYQPLSSYCIFSFVYFRTA